MSRKDNNHGKLLKMHKRLEKTWDKIAIDLYEAARYHAAKAIMLLSDENLYFPNSLDAAEHVGACVELYVKAVLSVQSPVLLFPSENAMRQVYEVGNSPEVLKDVRTENISQLLIYYYPLDKKHDSSDFKLANEFLSVRNSAVHMAFSPKEPKKIVVKFTRWLRSSLEKDGLDPENFFAEQYEDADFLWKYQYNKDINKLTDRVSQTRERVNKRSEKKNKKLEKQSEEIVLADQENPDLILLNCPVCGHKCIRETRWVPITTYSDVDENGDVASDCDEYPEYYWECKVCDETYCQQFVDTVNELGLGFDSK